MLANTDEMNVMLILIVAIYLTLSRTENIFLNPGEDKLYSIVAGDTITLLCPVNSSNSDVRWSYTNTNNDRYILSIGANLNAAEFPFDVAYTNNLKQVIYLRIYNITSETQRIFKCYFLFNNIYFEYNYTIKLANVTSSLVKTKNGIVCCEVLCKFTKAASFIWEQRTLFDEHIRFIKRVKINNSTLSKMDKTYAKLNSSHAISCLDINITGMLSYKREGKYICIAHILMDGRSQMINRTASFDIENIQDRPLCIQHTRIQRSVLGANTSIGIDFYSKPKYLTLSYRKDNSDLNLSDTVSKKNISLDIYTVTVMVSGYAIQINIDEFSEEDIGNYTVNIANTIGHCNCTVQLLSQGILELKTLSGFRILTISIVLFVTASICIISIRICHKISKLQFKTNEIDISREPVEVTADYNGYYTIDDENLHSEDIENISELRSTIRESLSDLDVQIHPEASGFNDLLIEVDDYLHPYCTMIQDTTEIHEYIDLASGFVERDNTDAVLNQEFTRSYENLKF